MDILSFVRELGELATAALSLEVNTLSAMLSQPNAGWVALGLVLLSGISRLIGESVVLFINHVPARRFGVALLGGAAGFALELGFWALSIWIVATIVFNSAQTFGLTWLLVAVASAPWLFGFLVFLPYFGLVVRWILRIWSWLILLVLLQNVMNASLTVAFITATGGWLVLRGLELVFAQRERTIHDKFWTKITGQPSQLTFSEQSDALARELRETAEHS